MTAIVSVKNAKSLMVFAGLIVFYALICVLLNRQRWEICRPTLFSILPGPNRRGQHAGTQPVCNIKHYPYFYAATDNHYQPSLIGSW